MRITTANKKVQRCLKMFTIFFHFFDPPISTWSITENDIRRNGYLLLNEATTESPTTLYIVSPSTLYRG